MGVNIGATARQALNVNVAGLPVGKAVALSTAMGFGDAVKATVNTMTKGKVPQWAVGAGLAFVMVQKPVKNILGAELSELAALGILADTIDDQLDVRQRVGDFLAGLFSGGTKQTQSGSPPVLVDRRPQVIQGDRRQPSLAVRQAQEIVSRAGALAPLSGFVS